MKLTTPGLLILVGSIMLFSPSIFAADSKTNVLEQTKETEPFKIIVTPSKKRVHVKESFKVALEVKNITNTNRSFVVMSCSWDEHWRSDNPIIGSVTQFICTMNYPMNVNLVLGESYKREGDMQLFQAISTNKVSFRMGFTPMDYTPLHMENGRFIPPVEKEGKKTYWSDEVTVEVIQ
jgi:hypothetical protein